LPLVLIAMVNVVISLYYYLLVVKAAYLLEPAVEPPPMQVPAAVNVLAVALVTFMVVFGVYPQAFIEIARFAAAALIK
jgi:NADH-quinone oxidoreductase subunit N